MEAYARAVLRAVTAVCAIVAYVPVAAGDEPKRPTSPDTDGLDVLAIARAQDVAVDATYAHADGSDALALVPSARLRLADSAFLDGELPIGRGRQSDAFALGNITATAGLLPAAGRLVALAVRVSAPTSPSVGAGALTAAALAMPRIADPELFLVHTTAAEVVADWRWRGDAAWVQVETGVAGWWTPAAYETLLRATAAGGVRVDTWLDLSASFVTRVFAVRHAPEYFVHALTLGVIAHHRRGQLALRLEVPIDASARDANRFVVGLELRGR